MFQNRGKFFRSEETHANPAGADKPRSPVPTQTGKHVDTREHEHKLGAVLLDVPEIVKQPTLGGVVECAFQLFIFVKAEKHSKAVRHRFLDSGNPITEPTKWLGAE